MQWDEFVKACPEIGEQAQERFARDELVLLGTLRRDGWPRISPCEVDMAEGHLMLGMMWRSPKALDLRRDPRLAVHSVQCDRNAAQPDVKLYGRGVDITDPSLREAFREAIRARIHWAPDEPGFHLFTLDVSRAASVAFGSGEERVTAWDPNDGLRTRTKTV
jgi:hypothetical protein